MKKESNIMKKIILVMVMALTTVINATAPQEAKEEMKITDINDKSYTAYGTQNGIDIKELRGKVVIVDLFGHACPPCIRSIPHLIELQNKYKSELAIIAVEVQGYDNMELQEFAKDKSINYIVASEENSYSFVKYIQSRAQWDGGIPFLLILDTKGEVQLINTGMLLKSELEEIIEELIEEK